MLKQKLEILLKTAKTNLMMYRLVGTAGYKKRGLEALKKAQEIIENENEETGVYNVLEFKKAA
jgi:hypothetical protein